MSRMFMVTLRKLQESDAEALQHLRLLARQETPEAFALSLKDAWENDHQKVTEKIRKHHCLGAFHEGQLVGIVNMRREHYAKRKHIGWLWGLYVKKEFRKKGVGKKLLDGILEYARSKAKVRKLQLKVVSTNVTARSIYESNGFTVYGTEHDAMNIDGHFYDKVYMERFIA